MRQRQQMWVHNIHLFKTLGVPGQYLEHFGIKLCPILNLFDIHYNVRFIEESVNEEQESFVKESYRRNNHNYVIIHKDKFWLPQSHMNIGTWRLTKCLKTDGKKNKRFAWCCSCMRILTERARAIQLLSIPLLYNISSSHYSPRVDNMMIIHYVVWKDRGGCKDV